ncbi:MAG: hypothetical protein ACK5AZ_08025 [Bryobacteraceae bacterium]
MASSATVPVKLLDAKRADYTANAETWDSIELLYRGAHSLKARAERFLVKRPKELSDVYAARVSRFTYQNILGTVLGWYQAAMFETDPDILIRRADDGKLNEEQAAAYQRFLNDCDRCGTTYTDMWRRVYLSMLLFRSAFVLIDLPKIGGEPTTLAEQKAMGALDPYVVLYDPRQVINWETDEYGNLAWIVIQTTTERRAFGAETAVVDRWYYFDKAEYRVYESQRKEAAKKAETAALIDEGRHALADVGRVPVRWIQIPDGLWLASRAFLPALSHLDLQNAYHWGLFNGCLPTLYVKGEFEEPPNRSEISYIQVPADGEIGYIEPSGTSFSIAAAEIQALREEIYRQMYLQAQGRSSTAVASAQSGYSKEMDMAPSRDVLNGFGDVLRAGMQAVLGDVAAIRGDVDLKFDVRGFTFGEDQSGEELKTAQLAADLNIPSKTLEKEVQKKIARCLLKDARPDVIQKVEAEIDAAPTKEERAAEQEQRQREQIRASLAGATNRMVYANT